MKLTLVLCAVLTVATTASAAAAAAASPVEMDARAKKPGRLCMAWVTKCIVVSLACSDIILH